jgi:hypothetical protein
MNFGAGDKVIKFLMLGISFSMNVTTSFIKKFPNEIPSKPLWQFEIE